MILRKMINSLKSQNWTSLTLELLVLVVGIFLGLQAESWYQDQQKKQDQIDFIEEAYGLLKADVVDANTYLYDQIPNIIKNNAIVLKALNDGVLAEEDSKQFRAGLVLLLISSGHDDTAIEGMIESGQLTVLAGMPEVQKQFMELYALRKQGTMNAENAKSVLFSLLPVITRQVSLNNIINPDRTVKWLPPDFDFASLMEDKAAIRAIKHIISETNRMRRDMSIAQEKLIQVHEELAEILRKEGRLQ